MSDNIQTRFPFTQYPTGWFQVGYSDELAVGEVKPVKFFGQDLVLYRGEDGTARLMDAFCPHLGAHLGHGGTVEGNDIKCPFHAWKYDGSGKCVDIPYASKIPGKAKIRPWRLVERNRILFTWHDAQGGEPTWEVQELPEVESDEWTDIQKYSFKIKTHNIDMAENSVDAPHFMYVHKTFTANCTGTETEGHIFRSFNDVKVKLDRWGMEGDMDGNIVVNCHGFGFSYVRLFLAAEVITIATATPIDHETMDARFGFVVRKMDDPQLTEMVGNSVVEDIAQQVAEDKVIWENKSYVTRPVLCDGDGPIGEYRRWAQQFLPDFPTGEPKVAAAS